MTTESQEKLINDICDALSQDSVLRVAVIRWLAREHPKDFLAPVRIQGDVTGMSIQAPVVSCKEWQE